ncbi:MAG TPA: site-specific DNA-methyltransferase [Dehalococcoidia bacterium]
MTIYQGDVRDVLPSLPADSVDCIVTSPPYWGLRDYGTATWVGGDEACDHQYAKGGRNPETAGKQLTNKGTTFSQYEHDCRKCGATRVDSQLGIERTPEEYVANMVAVFRELRRVLKPSGTCWLNLGDSYAGSWGANGRGEGTNAPRPDLEAKHGTNAPNRNPPGLKPKDLVGIPWRVAFALQADGWVLRSDVVWAKSNPMPESVTDRPTKSHEMVFLLTKAKWVGPSRGRFADISDSDARWLAMFLDTEGSIVVKRVQRGARRWYGSQIVFSSTSAELVETARNIVGQGTVLRREGTNAPMFYYQLSNQAARDLLHRVYPFLIVKRSQAAIGVVLQDRLATKGKKRPGGFRAVEDDAWLERAWETNKSLNHFGTPDLSWVPAVKYGKWEPARYYFDADAVREQAIRPGDVQTFGGSKARDGEPIPADDPRYRNGSEQWGRTIISGLNGRNIRSVWTIATRPYPGAHFAVFPPELPERCIKAGSPVGGVILDPFAGSGTVGMVANRLSRRAILIDLNADYLKQQLKRNAQTPLGLAG